MVSTRIRPELFDEKEAMTRIRRLLLDLARGPSEISKGLLDEQRFGEDSVDSNRLDPYQVGISILSAYTNNPLRIFQQLSTRNQTFEKISLGDCIQACIFKTNLFSEKDRNNNEKHFTKLILKFLVYIRDNDDTYLDHKFLVNKILAFCSIARILPEKSISPEELKQVLSDYVSQQGRLLQISLTKVHTVAEYLQLTHKLKWGWSVAITVCFEKAIDSAYSKKENGFTDSLWLMSRTPGRALFFYKSETIDLQEKTKFVSLFEKEIVEYLLRFCEEASQLIDVEDETDYFYTQEKLNEAVNNEELKEILSNMIRINNSGSRKYMFQLCDEEKSCNPKEHIIKWEKNAAYEHPPDWTKSLKLPSARGNRRFRMIQSLWQDIISLGNNHPETKVRFQGLSENKSFVYLDCIQLGDLLWQDNNWIRCFTKAKMLAPIIEGFLSSFISAFDTLYPNYEGDDLEFGPMALGGDELHLIVPENKQSVEQIISQIDNKLREHLVNYGLVEIIEWKTRKKSDRLVLTKNSSYKNPFPSCPLRMWWFGIVDLNDGSSNIDDFLKQIRELKDEGRKSWDSKNPTKTMFYTLL
tara:strand:- start:760 stop:2505 length:1746 start_codon:yes stop_codon:yes gene_type:complete